MANEDENTTMTNEEAQQLVDSGEATPGPASDQGDGATTEPAKAEDETEGAPV